MTERAEPTTGRDVRQVLIRFLDMFGGRTMADFAGEAIVVRSCFGLYNVVMAIGTDLISRIGHLFGGLFLDRIGAVVTEIAK